MSSAFVGVGQLKFDIEFNVEATRFTVSSVSDSEATLVDWILMLETLGVRLKARFADQVSKLWDKEKGFSESEKNLILREINKLEGPHPNEKEHEQVLNLVLAQLVEKLELKNNMEHMN